MPESVHPFLSALCLTVDDSLAGRRLDAALDALVPGMGVRARRRLIEEGRVLHNDRPARRPGVCVRRGDTLQLRDAPQTVSSAASPWDYPALQPRLLDRQPPYVFLFKPAGLHSVALSGSASASLEARLPALLPGEDLRLLQRLDLETSGLICATASSDAERAFRRAEARGEVVKGYIAVLRGVLENPVTARASIAMNGGSAVRVRAGDDQDAGRWTSFQPLWQWQAHEAAVIAHALQMPVPDSPLTLVACRIERGARHQIRAHAAWLGMPLWGDSRYGEEQGEHFFLHHGLFRMGNVECCCPPPWIAALDAISGQAAAAVHSYLECAASVTAPLLE